jgi:hypothetical protein
MPSGAKQATEHLLATSATGASGHRRNARLVATEERLAGFRAALAGAGILLDPELVVYPTGGSRGAARRRRGSCSLPTRRRRSSASTTTSRIGAAARRASETDGARRSVGGRLRRHRAAVIVTPRLTSVRQPLAELGRMGVSLLTRLIDGQRVDALRVELATQLWSFASRRRRFGPEPMRVAVAITLALHLLAAVARAALGTAALAERLPSSPSSSPTYQLATRRTSIPSSSTRGDRGEPDRPVVDVELRRGIEHVVPGGTQAAAGPSRSGGPTGVAYYGGKASFRVPGRACLDPARLHLRVRGRKLRA